MSSWHDRDGAVASHPVCTVSSKALVPRAGQNGVRERRGGRAQWWTSAYSMRLGAGTGERADGVGSSAVSRRGSQAPQERGRRRGMADVMAGVVVPVARSAPFALPDMEAAPSDLTTLRLALVPRPTVPILWTCGFLSLGSCRRRTALCRALSTCPPQMRPRSAFVFSCALARPPSSPLGLLATMYC